LTNFIKGHDVSVEAFHRLYRSNPGRELYCVLVGTGADTEALRAQAAATSCPDRFRFPGTTESPWEAHCGLDVFLMPSRFEGLGLALLEAMACGVCPVVMAEGGIQDVVTNPEIGWSTPPGDRDAFLRSMQEALDLGEAGRRALGLRARQHVVRNFDAEEQYGRLADLIERL
jgi:glycosyltransferase involved in cell wall biosynthesis